MNKYIFRLFDLWLSVFIIISNLRAFIHLRNILKYRGKKYFLLNFSYNQTCLYIILFLILTQCGVPLLYFSGDWKGGVGRSFKCLICFLLQWGLPILPRFPVFAAQNLGTKFIANSVKDLKQRISKVSSKRSWYYRGSTVFQKFFMQKTLRNLI